jgi:subtilisin family serine protease
LSAFLFAAVFAFLGPAGFSPEARAQVNTTVLEYDEQGRAIGTRQRQGAPGDTEEDEEARPAAQPRPNPRTRATAPGRDQTQPDQRFVPGEIVVTNVPEGFDAGVRRLGFRVLERVTIKSLDLRIFRLQIPRRLDVDQAMEALRRAYPGVMTDVNTVFEPSATGRPASLARERVGWVPADDACGAGVRLGLIDGWVDLEHPALQGQDIEFCSFHREERKPGAADHGTAMAALLVGKPVGEGFGGLLPGAKLMAANMFEVNQSGRTVGNLVAMLRALEWLIEEGVHVVNLSIAGGNNTLMQLAFKKAQINGLVAVAAAGNWASDDRPAFPAALPGVVAVTAIDEKLLVYPRANRGDYIDFAAPGVEMWTAVPGGGKVQSGTSFATPYIAAIVGLAVARGARPNAETETLRGLLGRRTFDLGAPGKDSVFGRGLVVGEPRCGT